MSDIKPLDLDFVRSFFKGLENRCILFDNAGGSQILNTVVERMQDYLYGVNVQHGASYSVSDKAGKYVSEAIDFLRYYVNASEPCEIIMGQSTSWLLRMLAHSLVQTFTPGDEVIVTNVDHEANIGPWVDLEKHGIVVKFWNINQDTLKLDADDLRRLLTKRTRLVACQHVSNVLGSINDIQEFTQLTHDAGALICVDGVAYAPHRLIDVREWDVDFYAFSCYKVFGPHYALLYGKKSLLVDLPGQNHYFIGKEDIPYKFQPGNANFELTYSMLGLKDYFQALSGYQGSGDITDRTQLSKIFEQIEAHEQSLSDHFISFLNSIPDVKIIGFPHSQNRVPTFSFVAGEKCSKSIVEQVDKYNIGIRYGDFYAKRLIEALGLDQQNGVIRVSLVHYNTKAELDQLIEVLEPLIS